MSPEIAVLPGAGSFGGELRPLMRAFARQAWLVRYPGRFGPSFGRPAASFEQVVQSCVEQVARRPTDRPVLVGHSFGAYVGYAAAAELESLGAGPAALVVVGAMPPHLFAVSGELTRSRAALVDYLNEINPDIDAAGEWRDVMIDTAMSDLTLLSGFRPSRGGALGCPILAARGASDPLTTTDGLVEWSRATRGAFDQRVFAGGHTDLLSDGAFAAWLRDAISDRQQTHVQR